MHSPIHNGADFLTVSYTFSTIHSTYGARAISRRTYLVEGNTEGMNNVDTATPTSGFGNILSGARVVYNLSTMNSLFNAGINEFYLIAGTNVSAIPIGARHRQRRPTSMKYKKTSILSSFIINRAVRYGRHRKR